MPQKVWFITGASSGFGRALTRVALERGDRVIATARNTSTLADMIVQWSSGIHVAELDVTKPGQIEKVIQESLDVFGRIDVLVNNAGYGLLGSVEECSETQIRRNFEVNFFGALNVTRCILPHFRAQRSGHILNVSAAAAIANYPGFGVYGAAKCALEGLSESLAAEVRTFGAKVTIVEPGPFRTDFVSRSLETVVTKLAEYEGNVGRFAKLIAAMDGKQPGDPTRAGYVMYEVVHSEKPPLRLVLGKYAIDKTRRTLSQRDLELKAWEQSGVGADGSSA